MATPKTPSKVSYEAKNGDVLCGLCEKHSGTESTAFYCEECHIYICESCTVTHLRCKGTRDHHVENKNGYIPEICPKHVLLYVKYCNNCKEFCCRLCYYELHKDHQLIDLQEFCKKARNKIYNVIEQCESVMSSLNSQKANLQSRRNEYNKQVYILKSKLEKKFALMHQTIVEVKTMIMDELDSPPAELQLRTSLNKMSELTEDMMMSSIQLLKSSPLNLINKVDNHVKHLEHLLAIPACKPAALEPPAYIDNDNDCKEFFKYVMNSCVSFRDSKTPPTAFRCNYVGPEQPIKHKVGFACFAVHSTCVLITSQVSIYQFSLCGKYINQIQIVEAENNNYITSLAIIRESVLVVLKNCKGFLEIDINNIKGEVRSHLFELKIQLMASNSKDSVVIICDDSIVRLLTSNYRIRVCKDIGCKNISNVCISPKLSNRCQIGVFFDNYNIFILNENLSIIYSLVSPLKESTLPLVDCLFDQYQNALICSSKTIYILGSVQYTEVIKRMIPDTPNLMSVRQLNERTLLTLSKELVVSHVIYNT